jgi:hypothetical protein
MPVVVRYHLERDASVLENHVQQIKTTKEPLTFYENIDRSIKILSSLSEKVHDQRNRFGGEQFPQMMLIHVLNFLSPKMSALSQRICGTWKRALSSPLARRLLPPSMVIDAVYRGSWETQHKPRSMTLLPAYFSSATPSHTPYSLHCPPAPNLLICDPTLHSLEVWNRDGLVIDRWEVGMDVHKVVANEQFICYNQNSNLGLLSIAGTTQGETGGTLPTQVQVWNIPHCNGLAMDNEAIYLTSLSTVLVYSLSKETRGKLISSFDLKLNPESQLARRVAIYRNEIFIVDHLYACVEVYNKEGKLQRKWGKRGKNPGEFRDPWGVAVAEERVYVVDAGNARIQVFTVKGDFLFQVQPPTTHRRCDLADIVVCDGKLYVSDWNHQVLVFKLVYS